MIILIGIITFLIFFQGGFYPSAYVLPGILAAFVLLFSKSKIKITREIIALFALSIVYIISTFANGLSYSALSQAIRPTVVLLIVLIFTQLNKQKQDKVVETIRIIGIGSSIIGILLFFGVISMEGAINQGRLQFTFQYANTAGCWYGLSFLLGLSSDNKYVKYASIINLIPLFMTGSKGAVIMLIVVVSLYVVTVEFQKRTKNSRAFAIGYILAMISVVPITMAVAPTVFYTFYERGIQVIDGFKILMDNLILGIGAGNWEFIYPYYCKV